MRRRKETPWLNSTNSPLPSTSKLKSTLRPSNPYYNKLRPRLSYSLSTQIKYLISPQLSHLTPRRLTYSTSHKFHLAKKTRRDPPRPGLSLTSSTVPNVRGGNIQTRGRICVIELLHQLTKKSYYHHSSKKSTTCKKFPFFLPSQHLTPPPHSSSPFPSIHLSCGWFKISWFFCWLRC